MFTGLIEEKGIIKNLDIKGSSGTISISCAEVLKDTKIGDSIAVDGICLTVTRLGVDFFEADVMAETVRRSSLKEKYRGSKVNLERAMPVYGRFGGHIVSGHIDGTGIVEDIRTEENAVWFSISASNKILSHIIEKGSVAIDGISLTVAYIDDVKFKVSIIPHTIGETTLSERRRGDIVNLENDLIGKYVEKFINPPSKEGDLKSVKKSNIDLDFLRENGF